MAVIAMTPVLECEMPMCAVCNKPTDRIIRTEDPSRMVAVLTVECHGRRESVEVTEELIEDDRIVGFGLAFAGDSMLLPSHDVHGLPSIP